MLNGWKMKSNEGVSVEVVVAPSSEHLPLVMSKLGKDVHVAAQDCWVEKGGAFTGESSAEQLAGLGISYVVTGNSDRRLILKESNEVVAQKCAYALSKGLKVILCMGETLEEREAGNTMKVCEEQLQAVQAAIGQGDWENLVIVYEPVWAMGTGKVATPEEAGKVHLEIRCWLTDQISNEVGEITRIIYGGSVTAANCEELARQDHVDGFLVGEASLKPEFIDIIVNSAMVKEEEGQECYI
ncbi:hypothetical protein CBR_g23091 [Chara braunii]|uniref:triose-phosphate isomerase n=1 Tax=Chara braunii TaxID=69332 RepID=A0A388L3J6_CHABU|nr:hypothetical protein CBR_g23091 [Chara braunii]|eukprot:GBG76876.1 hypothetical protein CBR_g23091 [Chara braunii]